MKQNNTKKNSFIKIKKREVLIMHRVYDDRTNETLFESEDSLECVTFINENFDENEDDFEYVWIERIAK